jgi:AraC-like DNA-binding protein
MMLGSASVSGSFAGLLQRYCQQYDLTVPTGCTRISPSERITVRQLGQMLELIQAQQPTRTAIGLEIGRLAQVADGGVMGYLGLSCATLWEMLLRFTRYHRLVYDANEMNIEFQNDFLSIYWGVEAFKPSVLLDDLLLSMLIQLIRVMIDQEDLQLYCVQLMHPKETDCAPYQHFYGCAVEMGHERTCIQLPMTLLGIQFKHADPQQIIRLEQQAEALLMALPAVDAFDADMRQALIKCMHNGEPNLEQIASVLNLSVRSLQRRLSEQQQTFQQVLAKTRQHLATQYLQDLTLSLNDISFLLGYSEQSAFQRAFKHWTDQTPQQVRQALTSNPSS